MNDPRGEKAYRLLDDFAKAALTGMLASNYEHLGYKEAAEQAFEYALAMVDERRKYVPDLRR